MPLSRGPKQPLEVPARCSGVCSFISFLFHLFSRKVRLFKASPAVKGVVKKHQKR